jgi:hypothetical protein
MAEIQAVFDQAGITDLDVVLNLKRLMTVQKMGIVQKTGDVVELGDDAMAQLGATKTLAQMKGWLAGGARVEKEAQPEQAPVAIQVNFPVRNIREEVVIDGDDSYSVSP